MVLKESTDLSIFHDAKIGDFKYEYSNNKLDLTLYFDSSHLKGESHLIAENVSFVQIDSKEPWGKGIYVNEVKILKKNDEMELSLLLNSGDRYVLHAELFLLKI
jgi:hypothetical protein